MRVKIIEAMTPEVSIIITSVGHEGIPIQHPKDCLIANTVEELIHAILDFSRMEDCSNQLVSNALRAATENFSWNSISQKTVKLYRNIVEKQ